MPLSTTTTSGGWRRTSRRAQVQARRRRSTGPLGVYAEEQTRGVAIIAEVEPPLGATVEVEVPRSPSSGSVVERPLGVVADVVVAHDPSSHHGHQ